MIKMRIVSRFDPVQAANYSSLACSNASTEIGFNITELVALDLDDILMPDPVGGVNASTEVAPETGEGDVEGEAPTSAVAEALAMVEDKAELLRSKTFDSYLWKSPAPSRPCSHSDVTKNLGVGLSAGQGGPLHLPHVRYQPEEGARRWRGHPRTLVASLPLVRGQGDLAHGNQALLEDPRSLPIENYVPFRLFPVSAGRSIQTILQPEG